MSPAVRRTERGVWASPRDTYAFHVFSNNYLSSMIYKLRREDFAVHTFRDLYGCVLDPAVDFGTP